MDEEKISKIYSINYTEKGYEIRPRGNEPVLPYGELTICGQRAIIKKPKPIMRKIKKQTGELHLSGLPLEIPLEDIVIWFEEKFGIKVENAKLGEAYGFSIYNGNRILEIEKTKLYTMKRVFFLKGIQTRTWYKGCIYHRKCHRCGKTGHSPNKCTTNEDMTTNNVNNIASNEQNDGETEQQNKILTKPKETLTMTGKREHQNPSYYPVPSTSLEIKSTDKHQINETGTKQIESNKQTRTNTDKQQTKKGKTQDGNNKTLE
ncbi:hypothetical protein ACJMK2_023916 [Sinanodonta woodiana]|uniref:CCHC-type domain-containing protein n=1 Tax=Sinanodonta woodiana TaxID=1069815 RepID=A0ABD3T6J5_SINWO